MNWFETIFIFVWFIVGLHAWLISFQTWFRWWWTSSLFDKFLMGIVMLLTCCLGAILGPIGYILWPTSDPRNYR
jgi:hypothetical protein